MKPTLENRIACILSDSMPEIPVDWLGEAEMILEWKAGKRGEPRIWEWLAGNTKAEIEKLTSENQKNETRN